MPGFSGGMSLWPAMNCPRDSGMLASNDVNGARYYSCETCQGFWIRGVDIRAAMVRQGITEPDLRGHPLLPAIQCPVCRQACRVLRHQDCEIDVCESCRGVWLDKDELLKVRTLFPANAPYVLAAQNPAPKPDQEAAVFFTFDALANLLAAFGL